MQTRLGNWFNEGVVSGFSPEAEKFGSGGGMQFSMGHDEFEVAVGELEGGV